LQLRTEVQQLGQAVHPQQKQTTAEPQKQQPDIPRLFIPLRSIHGSLLFNHWIE
jgi:hypothetical protein